MEKQKPKCPSCGSITVMSTDKRRLAENRNLETEYLCVDCDKVFFDITVCYTCPTIINSKYYKSTRTGKVHCLKCFDEGKHKEVKMIGER